MTDDAKMKAYYAKRAAEYEKIYEKPERQAELDWLRKRIPTLFRKKTVLEIACGTGYWTQFIAPAAKQLHASDINTSVLEIARDKSYPPGRVAFSQADALTLEGAPPGCDAAFAGFWWSHVMKADLKRFVHALAATLERGSTVAILDNTFAEGSSTPVSRTDADGNTFQQRSLANGDKYEVLKNFPSSQELAEAVRPIAREAHLESLRYYWLLVFKLK